MNKNKNIWRKSIRKKTKAVALAGLLSGAMVLSSCASATSKDIQTQESAGQPGKGSQGISNISWSGANSASDLKDNGSYTSTSADENAILADDGKTYSASGITVEKSGDSDGGDASNFYGTNSGILVKDGSKLTLEDATITTTANGANGIFSYGGNGGSNGASGDGTTVTIKNSTIKTSGNNAGGTMTTGGGTSNVENCTITTSGTSSAPIRSDRGGGTVNVKGGTYTSSGTGSPAIYVTAAITVQDAELISKTSEGIVVEGANDIVLTDTDITADNTKKNGQSTTYQGVMLYQSMSGDSANGGDSFTMKGGSFTNKNGSVFYVTNQTSKIKLTDVDITNEASDGVLLKAAAGAWGNSGSNGGQVTLEASDQTLKGTIQVDDISTLALSLKDSSDYTGKIDSDGSTVVTVEKGSVWKLTGDSTIDGLSNSGTVDLNGHTLTINGTKYTDESKLFGTIGKTEVTTKSSTSSKKDSTSDNQKDSSEKSDGNGAPDGNGMPPEPPSGSGAPDGNGMPPEPPSGSGAPDGMPPELPSGSGAPDGNGMPPQRPSGSGAPDGNGMPPQRSSGSGAPDGNGMPPQRPSGSGAPDGRPPQRPDGNGNGENAAPPDFPMVSGAPSGDRKVPENSDENGTNNDGNQVAPPELPSGSGAPEGMPPQRPDENGTNNDGNQVAPPELPSGSGAPTENGTKNDQVTIPELPSTSSAPVGNETVKAPSESPSATVNEKTQTNSQKDDQDDDDDEDEHSESLVIKKVNSKSKRLTVTWNEIDEADGYQIQVATDKNFTKGKKQKLIANEEITSATIRRLKKKTTYYVRVRSYTKKNGKKVFSDWSDSYKIATK